MAVKTYNAGVKEYRQTYWTPEYTPLDTDILACFKITPQPGVAREEVAAAVAAAVAETGAAGPADMGKVMAVLKPRLAGKADMAEVSKLVKAALAG